MKTLAGWMGGLLGGTLGGLIANAIQPVIETKVPWMMILAGLAAGIAVRIACKANRSAWTGLIAAVCTILSIVGVTVAVSFLSVQNTKRKVAESLPSGQNEFSEPSTGPIADSQQPDSEQPDSGKSNGERAGEDPTPETAEPEKESSSTDEISESETDDRSTADSSDAGSGVDASPVSKQLSGNQGAPLRPKEKSGRVEVPRPMLPTVIYLLSATLAFLIAYVEVPGPSSPDSSTSTETAGTDDQSLES